MFPPAPRFKLLQTTLSLPPLLSRRGGPGFQKCAVCRITIIIILFFFLRQPLANSLRDVLVVFFRSWITRVFRLVVVQICFAGYVVIYSFTLLEFRCNIRCFLLLSSLRLCRYFNNRLQMLT